MIIHIVVNIECAAARTCGASFVRRGLLGDDAARLGGSANGIVRRDYDTLRSLRDRRLVGDDGLRILGIVDVVGARGPDGVELAELVYGPKGRADCTRGRQRAWYLVHGEERMLTDLIERWPSKQELFQRRRKS